MFFKKKQFKPNIDIYMIDKTEYKPGKHDNPFCIAALGGPTNSIINLCVNKPKWYQFWKIKQYKKDRKEAYDRFIECFGEPELIPEKSEAAFRAIFEKDKLFTTRVEG